MKKAKIEGQSHEPALMIARQDFAVILEGSTIQEALDAIRSQGVGERVIYFYVVNGAGSLKGVIPTRRLLLAPLDQKVSDIMIKKVAKIPESTTTLEAHATLAKKKLMALPIVDKQDRIKGVVDIGMFMHRPPDELDRGMIDEIFELIGVHITEARDASLARVFRFRFPWLMATITSGTACALLTSIFDLTLAKSLVLAFFLTLVLGLGESVSMQSMSVAIHSLRSRRPSMKWFRGALRREFGAGLMQGAVSGLIVGIIVWAWRGEMLTAIAISISILLVIIVNTLWGLFIPSFLHLAKLDPKIAAGPVTLAIADICTILIYFCLAMVLI